MPPHLLLSCICRLNWLVRMENQVFFRFQTKFFWCEHFGSLVAGLQPKIEWCAASTLFQTTSDRLPVQSRQHTALLWVLRIMSDRLKPQCLWISLFFPAEGKLHSGSQTQTHTHGLLGTHQLLTAKSNIPIRFESTWNSLSTHPIHASLLHSWACFFFSCLACVDFQGGDGYSCLHLPLPECASLSFTEQP